MTDREKAFLGFLFLILTMLSGCTPQKKLARLCKNYPLICETSIDTVYQIREIPTIDTIKVIEHRTLIDTFEVTNGRATARVIVKRDTILKRDSVLVTLEQVSDTIIQIKHKEVVKHRNTSRWIWWVLVPLVLIIIIYLRRA